MNHTSDDVWVAAKFRAPQGIRENRHVRAIGLHFVLQEIASESRLDAQRSEKIRSHLRCKRVLGFAVCRKSEGIAAVSRKRLNALRRALPIQIVRVRDLCARRAVVILTARLAEMEELAGFAVRQWAQQRRIDDGENGRVCADAQSHGEHRHHAKSGIFAKHAPAVAQILSEILQPG